MDIDINGKILHKMMEFNHILKETFGGRGGQKRILAFLRRNGSVSQAELTRRIGVSAGSSSEILSKLENLEYIIRSENPSDHRVVDVSLTEKGKAEADEVIIDFDARKKILFSRLDESEKEQLLSLFEKLTMNGVEK